MIRKGVSSILCAFLILAGIFSPVWGQSHQESATIDMKDLSTGASKKYPVVNLMLGASDLISDVPGIIFSYNGAERTLVPIRVIAEGLGAKVSWDEDQERVSILYKGKQIFLKIDRASANVDGHTYALPDGVPAKRMAYDGASRTLVPVRFITDQFGLKVHWVSKTSTVVIHKEQQALTQMQYLGKGAYQEVVIQTSGPVEPAVYSVKPTGKDQVYQLILELPNTVLKYSDSTKLDKLGRAILGIFDKDLRKCEAYQVPGEAVPKVRITLTMDRSRGYEIVKDSKGLKIRFVNTVKSFYEDEIQGAKALVVLTSENPTYNVTSKGKQLTVDILDTKLSADVATSAVVKVGNGGISSYQYLQMSGSESYGKDKPFTRLLVNLDSEALQDHVYIDDADGRVYVYVSKHPIGDFFYGKDGESTAMLSLIGKGNVSYDTQYNAANRELRIQVPETFAYINDFEVRPNDQLVESLTVTKSDGYYQISMMLESGVTYVDRGKGTAKGTIELTFANEVLKETIDENLQQDKFIVIDAGHGGKDPGAISKINGLKEKDVVLLIALKIKQRLESNGFRVYLTRDYDTYVDLYNRAQIANDLKADVFLSIHANSAVSTANGVEMLYAKDARESIVFARSLQKALVDATGARDRGVVERANLVVLRETTMPAVLAEVGFLSNPKESELLMNSDYIQQIVGGLTQGILNYFNDK